MEQSSYLTLINSLLLTISGTSFLIIGYFLKDIYHDYKKQAEKINQMHMDLNTHVSLFKELTHIFQTQMYELQDRVAELEKRLQNK